MWGYRCYYYKITIFAENRFIFGQEEGNYAGGIYKVDDWGKELVTILRKDLDLKKLL